MGTSYTTDKKIISTDLIKPQIPWEDIKIGEIYHIARLGVTEAKDIYVKDVLPYYLKCIDINKDNDNSTIMIYKGTMEHRLLTRHKYNDNINSLKEKFKIKLIV